MSNNPSLYKKAKMRFADYLRKITYPMASAVFNAKPSSLPFKVKDRMNILFMRHDVLGDMITTLPLFRLVKTHFPNANIHVLATKSNASILEFCEYVDRIHIVPISILGKPYKHLSTIQKLKALEFDIIINCFTAQASQNGILTYLISAPKSLRATIDFGSRYLCYYNALSPLAARESNMWNRMFMLGADVFGIQFHEEERIPYLPAHEMHKESALHIINDFGLQPKKFIAINISTGQARNRWTIDGYIALISFLKQEGYDVLLFGLESDFCIIEKLQAAFPGINYFPFKKKLAEVGMALKQALLSISPDTGFVHLATSALVPQIILAQSNGSTIDEWSPIYIPFKKIIADNNAFVETISPEKVIAITRDFLQEIAAS